MDDQEIIKEFLVESSENLSRLDQEMVELEERPEDTELLASIFRTIHTIKGTCGFLGFETLEGITHLTENILSQLRSGERKVTPELVSLILEAVDATKEILGSIEARSSEGEDVYEDLRRRLREASEGEAVAGPEPGAAEGEGPGRGEAEAKAESETGPEAESAEPAAEAVAAKAEAAKAESSEGRPEAAAEAAAPAGAGAPQGSPKSSALADSTIRVGVDLLDKLMNLVGELVLTRNQILQFNAQRDDTTMNATSQRLNLITTELQEGVMKTRMQPIGVVWNKFPRVVRDLARSSSARRFTWRWTGPKPSWTGPSSRRSRTR